MLIINSQISCAFSVHMAEWYYVGVDVGTASVRAALVTREGLLKSTAEEPVSIWEPQSDHYVQSSTEIWDKCCMVVKVRRVSSCYCYPCVSDVGPRHCARHN